MYAVLSLTCSSSAAPAATSSPNDYFMVPADFAGRGVAQPFEMAHAYELYMKRYETEAMRQAEMAAAAETDRQRTVHSLAVFGLYSGMGLGLAAGALWVAAC